jgi:hypothetical protein
MNCDNRAFWEAIRQALLAMVDAIERHILGCALTTAEIRRQYKRETKQTPG